MNLYFSVLIFATLWAFFLPSVPQSIYFHRKNDNHISLTHKEDIVLQQNNVNQIFQRSEQSKEYSSSRINISLIYKVKKAYILLWKDFLGAYSNSHVIKWSIWWSFSTCGYLQVISYIQLLWKTAVLPEDRIYNGAIDFLYTIIGEQINLYNSLV